MAARDRNVEVYRHLAAIDREIRPMQ